MMSTTLREQHTTVSVIEDLVQGRRPRSLCHCRSYLLDISERSFKVTLLHILIQLSFICFSSFGSLDHVLAKYNSGSVQTISSLINPIFTAYVDSNLVGTGKIAKAAIIGQQGGVWAATAGYTVRTKSCHLARLEVNIVVSSSSYLLLNKQQSTKPLVRNRTRSRVVV